MRLITAASITVMFCLAMGCSKGKGGTESPGTPDGGKIMQGSSQPAQPADIEAAVTKIVAEQMGVSQTDVNLQTSLVKDLKADDLDLVELTLALEDSFNITISDDEALKWTTVRDLVESVRRLHNPARKKQESVSMPAVPTSTVVAPAGTGH